MGSRPSLQPEADHILAPPLVQLALCISLSFPMTSNMEGDTTSFPTRVSLSLLYDTEEVWFFCWHRVRCYYFISICFTCLFFFLLLVILHFLRNYFLCSLRGKRHEFAIPLALPNIPWGNPHTWAGMLFFAGACPVFRVVAVAEQSAGIHGVVGPLPHGHATVVQLWFQWARQLADGYKGSWERHNSSWEAELVQTL